MKQYGNDASDIRLNICKLVDSYLNGTADFGSYKEDLMAMEPKDRANTMIRIMEFAVPKVKQIEISSIGGEKLPAINFIVPKP